MKRPAHYATRFPSLLRIACIGLSLCGVLISNAPIQAQSPDKVTLKSDRKSPRRPPEKSERDKSPTTTARQAPTDNSAQPLDSQSAPSAASASLSGCPYNTILVLDTIRIIFVELYNYPVNSAIPVTMTQTNTGTVGFALTDAGPYTQTLNIIVNTDANGNGVSQPVFTQGRTVGNTVAYGDTPYGATTTIPFYVLPQCNCPAIPVVP